MIIYMAGLIIGLAGGFAVRGKLSWLGSSVRLRWLAMLYAALGMQIFLAFAAASSRLSPDGRFGVLLASYLLLGAWLVMQAAGHRGILRVAFAVIGFGSALNFLVIAPNRGLPVSLYAAERAGAPLPQQTDERFAAKHVIASSKTIFNPLGDVIPIAPIRDVVSIGDLLVALGVALVIGAGMRSKPNDAEPEASQLMEDRPSLSMTSPMLDSRTTVQEFLGRCARAYAVGEGNEPMSEEARHPSDSSVMLSQAMSITDANLSGNVHGGVVMKLVDTAAGLAAVKHAHGRVVTVSMDEMSFLEPVFLTDVLTLCAQVNDAGRTSMEIGVRVEAENTLTGERRHVSSAYLVFVALDENGKPRQVPRLEPQTDEERSRMEDAKIRRRHRIARKEALASRRSAQTGSASPDPTTSTTTSSTSAP
ncbi:MAG: hypothetical protein NVSMB57_13090 [Actinomycetota bacterium]